MTHTLLSTLLSSWQPLLKTWLYLFNKLAIDEAHMALLLGSIIIKEAEQETILAEIRLRDELEHAVRFIRKTPSSLETSCSCSSPYYCDHRIAVAIHFMQEIDKASKKLEPLSLSEQEERWLEALKKEPSFQEEKQNFVLVYVLSEKRSSSKELVVEFSSVKRKKNGELSASKVKSYSIDDIGTWSEKMKVSLAEEDWDIIRDIWQLGIKQVASDLSLLQKMVKTKRCFWQDPSSKVLSWVKKEKNMQLEWEYTSDRHQRIELAAGPHTRCFFVQEKGFYIDLEAAECGELKLPLPVQMVKELVNSPLIQAEKASLIIKKLAGIIKDVPIKEKKTVQISDVKPACHLFIEIVSQRYYRQIEATLSFSYGKANLPCKFPIPEESSFIGKDAVYQVQRDLRAEIEAMKVLKEHALIQSSLEKGLFYRSVVSNDIEKVARDFHQEVVLALQKKGWIVTLDKSFPLKIIHDLSDDDAWFADTGSLQEDWFDLSIGTIIDGKKVNLVPVLRKILQSLSEKGTSLEDFTEQDLKKVLEVKIRDGEFLHIPFYRLKMIFQAFFGLLESKGENETVRLSKWQAVAMQDLQAKLQWQMPEQCRQIQERLKDIKKIEKVAIPKSLQCELRSYQVEGVSWLQFLRQSNLSGILADDMGLGKTIQTLAHIVIEKESGRMKKPALIVAPTTLIGNWLNESNRFAPHLKVLILQGFERKKFFDVIDEYDLVLTTYPLLARDQEVLLKKSFYFLILDEAQNVKNFNTQAHHVIREVQASHKLCLTGTPMENHLGELWSFFHILLPGFLGTEKQFTQLFRRPIEKEGSLERKKILQKRIHPFMLRRTKQEVALDLPSKTEILSRIELTQKQKDLYEAVRLTLMQKVLSVVEEKGLARSKIIVLDALLKLRQICCDPRLLKSAKETVSPEDSAKLNHLREMIPQLIQEKRQILLFSQFTSMLALIEEMLGSLEIPYTMITGDTLDRMTPVQEFQSGKKPILLVSLKAGGTGLNLTAADTVIIYDPWWNPAVESQAVDRAYRIGQTKPVFVYKLIAEGSIEEKIVSLQTKKKEIADALFDSSNTAPLQMDLEELQSLFEPLQG